MANLKSLITLLLLVVGLGGLYLLASQVDFFGSSIETAAKVEQEAAALQKEVQAGQDELSNVKMNESIFSSKEYTALVDRSVILPDPAVSRPDPFAPYR